MQNKMNSDLEEILRLLIPRNLNSSASGSNSNIGTSNASSSLSTHTGTICRSNSPNVAGKKKCALLFLTSLLFY